MGVALATFLTGIALTVFVGSAGIVYLAAVILLTVVAIRFVPRGLRAKLLALGFVALLVRVALVWLFQVALPPTEIGQRLLASDPRLAELTPHMGIALFYDEWKYEEVAWGIAQWWTAAAGHPGGLDPILLLPHVYLAAAGEAFGIRAEQASMYLLPHTYLDAAVYFLVGRDPLAARTAHAAIGALVPLLIYLLGSEWFGSRAGRLSGWTAALEPSLVFWSAWMLKEMLVVALIALVLLAVGRIARRTDWRWFFALTPALLLLTTSRRGAAICLALLLPLAALAVQRGRRNAVSLALLLLFIGSSVLWLGGEGFMGSRRLNPDLPSELVTVRNAGAEGARTAIVEQVAPNAIAQVQEPSPSNEEQGPSAASGSPALESASRNFAYLPIGIAHVLGAPFPWAAETTKDRLALSIVPLWYAVLLLALFGAVHSWRERDLALVLPAALFLALLLYLSLTDSSVGNIVRHRIMLLPILLPFAAQGAIRIAARMGLGLRIRVCCAPSAWP